MKKKILIVEDNNDFRAILVLLTNMGYQVIEAQNSKRGHCVHGVRSPSPYFYGYGTTVQWRNQHDRSSQKESKNLSHSYHCAYGMDVRTMAGKSFEIGHRNVSTKTCFTSDVKTDDRGIHCESLTRGNAIILSIFHPTQFESKSNLVKCTTGFPSTFI